jgi:hypothetical protein
MAGLLTTRGALTITGLPVVDSIAVAAVLFALTCVVRRGRLAPDIKAQAS